MLSKEIRIGALYYIDRDGVKKTPKTVMFSTYTGIAFTYDVGSLVPVFKEDSRRQLHTSDIDWYGMGATYEDGILKDWFVAEERSQE